MLVKPRSVPAAIAAAALTVTLAACGAGGDGSGGGSSSGGSAPASATIAPAAKDPALAALVPPAIAADGKLVFGADASYAPNEFTGPDGRTIIGVDVDLGRAIAQKLGLEAQFENSQFSGIIPGVQAKQYEAAMSSFSVTPERTKTVTMISYYTAGTSFATKKGNPDAVNPDDLCGKTIGVQAGTTQVDDVTERNAKCKAAGKPPIQSTELQAQSDVTLALTANRIAGMLADSPVAAYAVKTTDGAVEVVGKPYATAPYGVVIAKDQPQYAKAVQGAIDALIADGTHQKILEKWGVQDGAVTKSEIAG